MKSTLLVPDARWDAAMADPFLRLHQIGVRMLEIGPRLSPLSIRDQMVRAAMAVDRANEHHLISESSPLLVVGGGVAGCAAALRAIRLGVPVVLVEERPYLFYRQGECSTRWVSPTQYDWPASHAPLHRYPPDGGTMERTELPWLAGSGEELAEQWSVAFQLGHVKAGKSILSVYRRTRFADATVVQTTRGVQIEAALEPMPEQLLPRFALVLFAMGLGEEQCSIDGHRGAAFWDEDTYDQPNLGLPKGTRPKVLISGAGDGALQDYIRLVTGKQSALEVYENLGLSKIERADIERLAGSAEDEWQRASVWSTKAWDCELLQTLHARYQAIVDNLPEKVWKRMKVNLKTLRVPNEIEVRLIHTCDHFGRCYALNHMVALLLERHLSRQNVKSFQSGRLVKRVVGGECRSVKECHGCLHTVFSTDGACKITSPRAVTDEYDEGKYDVLVFRHGIRPPSPFGHALEVESRQILPYHMPWFPRR